MTAIGKVIKSKEMLFSSDYGITWNRQKNEILTQNLSQNAYF